MIQDVNIALNKSNVVFHINTKSAFGLLT